MEDFLVDFNNFMLILLRFFGPLPASHYVDPSQGLGAIAPFHQPLVEVRDVQSKILFIIFGCNPVHSSGRVVMKLLIGPYQHFPGDQVYYVFKLKLRIRFRHFR